jgi:hypothetical protein
MACRYITPKLITWRNPVNTMRSFAFSAVAAAIVLGLSGAVGGIIGHEVSKPK